MLSSVRCKLIPFRNSGLWFVNLQRPHVLSNPISSFCMLHALHLKLPYADKCIEDAVVDMWMLCRRCGVTCTLYSGRKDIHSQTLKGYKSSWSEYCSDLQSIQKKLADLQEHLQDVTENLTELRQKSASLKADDCRLASASMTLADAEKRLRQQLLLGQHSERPELLQVHQVQQQLHSMLSTATQCACCRSCTAAWLSRRSGPTLCVSCCTI